MRAARLCDNGGMEKKKYINADGQEFTIPETEAERVAESQRRHAVAEAQAEERLDMCNRECAWDAEGHKPANLNGRRGKIGRLPGPLRREVCQRLLQEQPARVILAWLNGLPEVKAALAPFFGNVRVSAQNLCHWRETGFEEWLRRSEREERTRELAE